MDVWAFSAGPRTIQKISGSGLQRALIRYLLCAERLYSTQGQAVRVRVGVLVSSWARLFESVCGGPAMVAHSYQALFCVGSPGGSAETKVLGPRGVAGG